MRLEPEWLYGHGYANAVFYCNALLYFPALLRLAGFSVTVSYNLYCVALGQATAWISWYCFGKIFNGDNVGILCSALYTLSVFRSYVFLGCGLVGEGSAYAFLPLVMYGLYRVFTENPKEKSYRTAWVPVALGYAGVIQTHVLTCEVTAFVTIVTCLICIRKIFCRNTFLELVKGVAGALGLSLWYLVPFLDYYITQDVHIKHVSARTIQERGLSLGQLLLGFEGEEYYPIGIGSVFLAGLCVFVVLFIRSLWRGKRQTQLKAAAFSAVMGVLLMAMSLKIFPWDKIQGLNAISMSLVSSLQFPRRFLGWATACLTVVCGFVLMFLRDRGKNLFQIGAAVAVAGVVTTGLYQISDIMSNYGTFRLYNEEGMGSGYISGAEYLIEGTNQGLLTYRGAQPGGGVKLLSYHKDYLRVEMRCVNEGAGESYVDLPMLYYKGYLAYEGESGREMEVGHGVNHVVRVTLPEGFDGDVRVRFSSPFYWRIGEFVTALTIAGMAVYLFLLRRRGSSSGAVEEKA